MHTLYWRPNVCHYCSLNGISGIQFTVVLYYCITRKLGLQISLDLQHFHRIFFHQNMHFFFNFKKALVSFGSSLRRQCFISKGSFELFFSVQYSGCIISGLLENSNIAAFLVHTIVVLVVEFQAPTIDYNQSHYTVAIR